MRVGIWADTLKTTPISALVAAFVLFAAYFVLWIKVLRKRVERYYDERFGRVGRRTFGPVPSVLVAYLGLAWTTIFLDAHAPWVLPVAIVVLSAATWPARIARRDSPYRAGWGLVAVAAIVAALQLPGDASRRFEWRTNAMLEVGLATAIAGLCDHLILVRTLVGVRREHAAANEGPTR
jgi:MFS superfamily sulfate permease-like transporter